MKLFDMVVRESIDRWFKIRFLKDQRLPVVYEEIPERKLIEEAYSIFFKSFDDILENVGIGKRRKNDLEITLWWSNTYHEITSLDIHFGNFPDIAKPDAYHTDEDRIHRGILRSVFGKEFKNLDNVKIRFKDIHLEILDKRHFKEYHMLLEERISKITDYVLIKSIANQLLRASRGMKYKTEEDRHHDDGFYEWDMYSYVKMFAEDYSSTIKTLEKEIWEPKIKADDKTNWILRIGQFMY